MTWLEAWLDNVMASVPELAICYHEGGVVQGYELLKTDDIFLLKGVSEDGTPAFYPHVVQQNGLSVLRFLQENCKQDPGAYWVIFHLFEFRSNDTSKKDMHSCQTNVGHRRFLDTQVHMSPTLFCVCPQICSHCLPSVTCLTLFAMRRTLLGSLFTMGM